MTTIYIGWCIVKGRMRVTRPHALCKLYRKDEEGKTDK
jgi:hypothetical protein